MTGTTVVIPLYNGARWIAQTLTSVQEQTTRPDSVLVIDDGSSDDGVRIARSHAVGATVISQPNLGVAVARNRGLALAQTEWIAFLDQDDLWHPEHLARSTGWLTAHPAEGIMMAGEIAFTVIDESERLRALDPKIASWASIFAPSEGTFEHLVGHADVTGSDAVENHDVRSLLRGPISVTTSFVARTELLRLAGGFAPHALAMDDYWMLVNVARLNPIPRCDQPTVFYRVHPAATSRTTKLGLPFLSSAVALRWGGGLADRESGVGDASTGPLHEHLLAELLDSPAYRTSDSRRVIDELARLLWPPHGNWRQRRRALLAARLPGVRTFVRRVRGMI